MPITPTPRGGYARRRSRTHGLPASLESSADYLNKKWKKLPDGKRLIGLYSIPATNRKTGERYFREIPADDGKKMLEYNVVDVESDREASSTLRKLPNFAVEEAAYRHDFCMNINGIRIDTAGLAHLVGVVERATERAMNDQRKYSVTWKDKNGEEYTDALNVRSVPKLKAWLASKGFDVDDTRIETLEEIYDNTDDAEERGFFIPLSSQKRALKNTAPLPTGFPLTAGCGISSSILARILDVLPVKVFRCITSQNQNGKRRQAGQGNCAPHKDHRRQDKLFGFGRARQKDFAGAYDPR